MAEKIVEHAAISMYEQDQSKYSIVVNRRRAIPAVQDGLKPVQRRVIFAAYRDRLTKPSLKAKSASLVGTTMKYYHPHGDCLGGDTVIYLANGNLATLRELYNAGTSVEIFATDPKTLRAVPAIAHSFRIGQYTNKIYRISFSNGYFVDCTSNHPFMLPNGSYIKAENLHPYMRLLSKNLYLNESIDKFGNKSIRPVLDNELVQNIVCNYYYGDIQPGFERHHKDFNTENNTRDNLIVLSSRDHVLIHQNDPSYSARYNEYMSHISCPVTFIDQNQDTDKEQKLRLQYNVSRVIDTIIDHNLPYTTESYLQCLKNDMCSIDTERINYYLEMYKYLHPFITDITVIDVYNEPMYDFTVDGFENMLIPLGNTYFSPFYKELGDIRPMISVHNSSIYETIVNLANWFKTKYPIFYGKGNWGTCAGDGAASSRYTECALSNFGFDILVDELAQSNNIVDWLDTYERKGEKEPEYMPAKLPLLLINGSFGIGVGMSINVPSHNLGEVIDATIKLIENPNSQVLLVPDLPQSCELIESDWKTISNTGRGSFKVRGKILTQQDKDGNYTLHIVSLPDQVNTTTIYDKICEMIANKQLPMIKDIFNSLDKEGRPDIIIHLRNGSDPGYVKQAIYAKTQVQQTVSVNFEAVSMNGIDLKRYSYKQYLLEFIDQRMNIKFRLYCNKLQQVMTRHMQVDAFVKVLQSKELDKIINMIRKYSGTDDIPIIEFMIKTCNITDIQAKFILTRTLPQLSKGHLNGYIAERKDLEAKIKNYMKYVTDDGTSIAKELVQELKELKAKYNTPRLCNVISVADENEIPAGTFKVVITEKNFIRKIPDVDKVGIVRKDNPKFILRVDNRENILIFDNKGKVYNLPVSKIPITDKSGVGTDVRIIVRNLTADIISVFSENILKKICESGNKHYLAVLTKSNTIKKLDLEDFLNVSPSGLIYSKVRPDDEVVGVSLVPYNLDIAISSGKKVLRCKFKDIPLYKRNAAGVRAMMTSEPINGLSIFYPGTSDIVVVTKNGKFNRFNIAMLECNSRGKSGHKVIKLDPTDEILNVFGVNESDKIRLLTSEGVEEVKVADIKVKSSIAAGTKMIKSKGVIVRADVIK